MVPLLFWCVNIRIMSCVCIYSISFYFCHNKLTRQILFVVIYFFCNVFLTIHTLVYVITFVLCHHLYLDVCVCPQVLNLSKLPVYYCIKFLTESYKLWSFFFVAFFIQQKNISKTCIAFLAHLAKGYVSFCHHLAFIVC